MKARWAVLLVLVLLSLPLASLAAEGEQAEKSAATEIIFKWLNFALIFGAAAYFLRQPMQRFFTGERAAIRGAIEEARQAREQSRQRLAEVEQRLARLEQEIEAMRKEAAASAAAEKQRIHEVARREAERILATAQAEINSATRAARLELRAYTARLAVTLAEERLQQQLTPEAHAALFETFVSHLAAARGPEASGRRP